MGNVDTVIFFAEFDQAFSHINGFLPVAGRLIDLQQLRKRAAAKIGFVHQLAEHIFGAIVKTRCHVIAPQLLYGQQTLIVGQRRAFHQRLVYANRAIDLAA